MDFLSEKSSERSSNDNSITPVHILPQEITNESNNWGVYDEDRPELSSFSM